MQSRRGPMKLKYKSLILLFSFLFTTSAEASLLTQIQFLKGKAQEERSKHVNSCVLLCLMLTGEVAITPILIPFGLLTINHWVQTDPFGEAHNERMMAKSYNLAIKQLSSAEKILKAIEKAFCLLGEIESNTEGEKKYLSGQERRMLRAAFLPNEIFHQAINRMHEINLKGSPKLESFQKELGEKSCSLIYDLLGKPSPRENG